MGANTGGETRTVNHVFSSTLESVDRAEELALKFARETGVDEEDQHRIGMAVREIMVNAVTHGNRYNAQKRVKVSVERSPEKFVIRICDEGEGFDPEGLPNPLADENLLRNSGRGIFLVKAFMDDFRVRRLSPAGTEVTLVKSTGSAKS